ncbi:MAG: hypothetical protein ACK4L4_18665 [Gemmobacter sp.]
MGDSHFGRADKPKRTGEMASACFRIRDVGKSKAPARGYLRALFFDDQGVRQGGHLCQTKNARGFNGFGQVASAGWLPAWWLPQTGFRGFRKTIQHAKIVIPQAFDNESLFPRSRAKWLPPGFPGEKARR